MSEPLLTFKAERLHRQYAQAPLRRGPALADLHVLGEATSRWRRARAPCTRPPGHGVDDYRIGSRYGLEIYAPVDEKGRLTEDFLSPPRGQKGMYVFKANEPIIKALEESGHLVARVDIQHSYPHCWRCHNPVIFRATPQWFIGMDLPEKGDNPGLRTQERRGRDSATSTGFRIGGSTGSSA